MRCSTLELLRDINTPGRLFHKNNYIILNGSIFPFFFLRYLKAILKKEYGIGEWFNLDIEQTKDFSSMNLYNNLHYYQENQIFSENNQSFGFIIDIREKNGLNIMQKLIDKSFNDNNYYIFFSYIIHEAIIKTHTYYFIDDIIYDENKIIFIEFLRKYSTEENFINCYFFLEHFYKKIEKQAYLEFFFNFFQYLPNIKKNNISEFIDHYITQSFHVLLNDSIFDLATYFFQKKIGIFFERWNKLKYKYSIEYWYYFWQEQLWYSQLALLNKANINNISFYKKVNRWFLKTGINCYKLNDLLDASIRLHHLDYLHKKLQANSELDLESFFYIWFYKES
jgi:hypothetical protein